MIPIKSVVLVEAFAQCPQCKKWLSNTRRITDNDRHTRLEAAVIEAMEVAEASVAADMTRRGWINICGACRDSTQTDKASCG